MGRHGVEVGHDQTGPREVRKKKRTSPCEATAMQKHRDTYRKYGNPNCG